MALLVALAMNQDHIVSDISVLDGADFGISGTSIEGNGKDQFISGLKVRGKIKDIQKGMYFLVGEGFNQNLAFFLPTNLCGGVGDDISLTVGEFEKCTEAFQNTIDITGGQILSNQILYVFFDMWWTDCFQCCYFFVFIQIVEEQGSVIVIPFGGSWTEPSQVTFHLEFFQTVFCQQKNHPFTVVRKRVIGISIIQVHFL